MDGICLPSAHFPSGFNVPLYAGSNRGQAVLAPKEERAASSGSSSSLDSEPPHYPPLLLLVSEDGSPRGRRACSSGPSRAGPVPGAHGARRGRTHACVGAHPEDTACEGHCSVCLRCCACDREQVTRNPWVCAHQEASPGGRRLG